MWFGAPEEEEGKPLMFTRSFDALAAGLGFLRAALADLAHVTNGNRSTRTYVPPRATWGKMWTSDGTAEGTRLLLDIEPGPVSSSPAGFATTPTGFVKRAKAPLPSA